MPPRRSKRGATSAKKPSPRAKTAASQQQQQQQQPPPETEIVPLNVIEENKVSESEVPSSIIVEEVNKEVSEPENVHQLSVLKEEKVLEQEELPLSIVESEVLSRPVEDDKETECKEINQVEEVSTTLTIEEVSTMRTSESEEVSPSNDEEKVVIKEEVSVTTVVETKVIEEIVEERNQEVASSDAALEVKLEESEPEEEYEEVEEEEEEEENENEDESMEDQEEDVEEETEAAEVEGSEDENGPIDANEGGNGEVEDDSDGSDDENEDEDPSAYMPPPSDRKKQKEFEIFVGGLDKGAVEEDLIKVFGEFGEIKSARIVKHPTTQKSKGFAFIRYATVEQAKTALAELKDGTEVRGKRVGISPSQDSDTLYIGNICKAWKKDQVLETLKSIGIELIEEIYLPDDPKHEGKSRGFALLEFNCHSDAMTAFQLLRKPDAVFGCDRSAKVAFAQSSIHPSEESLSQVKTVFVEGLTDSWDEEKLQEFCKQYGEIEKIQLSRKLVTTKRKDFGFVSFSSRESAVACVEGINSAQIAEGDIKVKANLAKPQYKGRLGKQAARGGYKIKGDDTEEAGSSKMKGQAISKGKGKSVPKVESAKGSKLSKPQPRGGERQGTRAPARSDRRSDRTDRHRTEQPTRGGKRGGRSQETDSHGRPSKKPRGGIRGRPSYGFDNRRNNPRFDNIRHSYGMAPVTYVNPYAQVYAPPASSYQGHSYGAHSGSKRSYSDMAPHAGYIEPSTTKQGRVPYGYESYDPRRPAGYGGQGSSGTAYGGSVHPPPPYVPSRTSYAGYQTGGSSGYGYPNPGAYPPRQGYY